MLPYCHQSVSHLLTAPACFTFRGFVYNYNLFSKPWKFFFGFFPLIPLHEMQQSSQSFWIFLKSTSKARPTEKAVIVKLSKIKTPTWKQTRKHRKQCPTWTMGRAQPIRSPFLTEHNGNSSFPTKQRGGPDGNLPRTEINREQATGVYTCNTCNNHRETQIEAGLAREMTFWSPTPRSHAIRDKTTRHPSVLWAENAHSLPLI